MKNDSIRVRNGLMPLELILLVEFQGIFMPSHLGSPCSSIIWSFPSSVVLKVMLAALLSVTLIDIHFQLLYILKDYKFSDNGLF